jgi:linoleoyl-CoA desaturase
MGPLHQELKARAAQYFADSRQSPRDPPAMYLKTAVILTWFVGSYVFLVFAAAGPWTALLGGVSLALAMAGIGFSVQHDANHGGYSEHRARNRWLGMTLDLLGGSSYVWSWKHNIFHHSHTNVVGLDVDIDMGVLARLAPSQRHRSLHRFQYLYIWILYGFLVVKWHVFDDFKDVITGSIGRQRMPRPTGGDLIRLIAGKLLFFGWAVAVPAMVRPLWQVALGYAVSIFLLGLTLAVIFQLAHCVGDADFPELPEGSEAQFQSDWAVHQIQTTVDFAPENRLVTWYLGGLNFQVVHHLFPTVCHVHYPALSRIVDETCRAHGIRYRVQRTLGSALGSHVRWLKRMGEPPMQATAGSVLSG